MRIHILGMGAMGTLYGSLLSKRFPVFITRPTLLYPLQTKQQLITQKFDLDTGNIDILLVTTKAFDVRNSVDQIKHRLSKHSIIILLVNGILRVYEEVLPIVPTSWIVLGTSTHGVTKRDGIYHHYQGSTFLGFPKEYPNWVVEKVQKIATVTELNIHVSRSRHELYEKLYTKLIVNVCLNPTSSIFMVQNGKLLSNQGKKIISLLVKESLAVLPSSLNFSEDRLTDSVFAVAKDTSSNLNSMLVDVQLGKKTEIDYILGHLLDMGRRKGINMPMHELLYHFTQFQIDQSLEKLKSGSIASGDQ